ncbi:cytochrome P450 [Aspergillus germanicus]
MFDARHSIPSNEQGKRGTRHLRWGSDDSFTEIGYAAPEVTLLRFQTGRKGVGELRQELAEASAGDLGTTGTAEDSIFAYDKVKDLPFLRACIDETLRLRPPLAYSLPRLVSRPTAIAGHTILPGTVVAVSPYSIHRHKSLYRDPDHYRPERWVDVDPAFPNQREDLKKYNIVFSQGSRACIGRRLAIVELQILISAMVIRYDSELDGRSKDDLEIFDRFNSNPGPMFVKLRKRVA